MSKYKNRVIKPDLDNGKPSDSPFEPLHFFDCVIEIKTPEDIENEDLDNNLIDGVYYEEVDDV